MIFKSLKLVFVDHESALAVGDGLEVVINGRLQRLTLGSQADVENEVRELIRDVGPGGGGSPRGPR